MGAGVTSTVFNPDPTCVASSNLWLTATRCNGLPRSIHDPDLTCTIAVQGQTKQNSGSGVGAVDNCYATSVNTIAYTDCPISYTAASSYSYWNGGYTQAVTYCCPGAYPYRWDPATSTYTWPDGGLYTFPRQPPCRATSVEVLRSQIVTVKITDAEQGVVETTTTSWADDDVLFAEAESVSARLYHFGATPSTCWGNDCPTSYEPTPTFPSAITTTPSIRFTPAPECLDPGNVWLVTTSCYITSPTYLNDNTPDWLRCSVTNFGPPGRSDPSCMIPYEAKTTTRAGETVYYEGCPLGYSGVATQSGPAYDTSRYQVGSFDISYYATYCCPTEYAFTRMPIESGFGQHTTTVYDDLTYGVYLFPMPACYATSVQAQSGKAVPMHTWSNTMAWDKRQEGGGGTPAFATTESWDYEHGTVYANNVLVSYTVFQGTHTCYESCSSWFTYYYADGTGVMPSSPSTTAVNTVTGNTQSQGATITSSGNTGPTEVAVSGAGLTHSSWFRAICGCVVVGLVMIFSTGV